jgi:hypothetical protein
MSDNHNGTGPICGNCGAVGLVEYYKFYGNKGCSVACLECGRDSGVKHTRAEAVKEFEVKR